MANVPLSSIGTSAYNDFKFFSNIAYNVISNLMENNETVWKLLKHNTPDAWNSSDLSQIEKAALIYPGGENITDYRVFMDTGQPDVWTEEVCILRVCPWFAKAKNRTIATVQIGFDMFCHYKINGLSNYTTRIDTMVEEIVKTLNGVEVGGLGKMFFDSLGDNGTKLSTIGSVPFKGKQIVMSTTLGGKGING